MEYFYENNSIMKQIIGAAIAGTLAICVPVMTYLGVKFEEVKQPEPYVIDSLTSIQPIVENIDLAKQYHYTQTIKITYCDPLKEPIKTRKPPDIYSRCSDSTRVTFVTTLGDSITKYSVKRMSCKILAYFNFTSKEIDRLKLAPTKEMILYNRVTDNTFKYSLNNSTYLQKTLISWTR